MHEIGGKIKLKDSRKTVNTTQTWWVIVNVISGTKNTNLLRFFPNFNFKLTQSLSCFQSKGVSTSDQPDFP